MNFNRLLQVSSANVDNLIVKSASDLIGHSFTKTSTSFGHKTAIVTGFL